MLLLLVLCPLSALAGGAVPPGRPEAVRARWLMGTVLELRLPADTPDVDGLAEAAFREVSAVEAAASLWRPGTELGAAQARAAAGDSVVLSETLGALVAAALAAARLTDGAFSPAVGALVDAYDLHGDGRWPTDDERRRGALLARVDGVGYDDATRTLSLAAGVRLDLDGIAKGFALDRAADALRRRGVDDALLNFGGQLLAIGPPAGSPSREALVASPFEGEGAVLAVPLRDASLSTSSNAERARLVAGKPAGHLLDPRTGVFADVGGSVSVLAPDGATADALSTAWAVEGPDRFRRSVPGSPLRHAARVAFVVRERVSTGETLVDPPFRRLRPPPFGAEAAVRPD